MEKGKVGNGRRWAVEFTDISTAPSSRNVPDPPGMIRLLLARRRMRKPIGKGRGLLFMCVFRFKLWWMTQRMGNCGQEIPFETQFLIVEAKDDSNESNLDTNNQNTLYTVFLPIIEGNFRAVLQGNEHDELEICLESGCPDVEEFEGTHLVYAVVGSDPFDVITNAVKSVERHLQTFSHRDRKKMPNILDWFGWCTWDAFYTDVSADGVKRGLERYVLKLADRLAKKDFRSIDEVEC